MPSPAGTERSWEEYQAAKNELTDEDAWEPDMDAFQEWRENRTDENVDNDIFAGDDLQTLWQALPTELRGLKVFRDARVVATPSAAERVKALAARRGMKTVVTVVPDAADTA